MAVELNDEQKRVLFKVLLRQNELGRDSSMLLMSALKERRGDLYDPLFESGFLTYEMFGTGKNAIASLIVTPRGLRYCIDRYDELALLIDGNLA